MRITVGVIIFAFLGCASIIFIKRVALIAYHFAPFQWRREYFRLRKEDTDLPIFDLSVIVKATNNFSSRNKLGEGGFGPVYKGTLIDGKEVAIKRHSKMSDQGLEEFKNEVALIAKLQHRNLVKLLGCCVKREEKLLIYEYMPNRSLDYFIFDESRSKLLAWPQRFDIIAGIARGLLYLHQDSRLRIIHRDLKTNNILLDAHMNPKISDFGLARTFRGHQVEAKTKRMIGTYGYMLPEYAVHGRYSMKSDVFSFGAIVLEIVSGNKINGFYDPEHSLNLLGHAWRFWTESRPMELLDTHLLETCSSSEVLRCIHVGLLCVQQKPGDRPDMSAVILMLNGEKLLPQPKAPGFYTGTDLPEAVFPSSNQMSLTIFEKSNKGNSEIKRSNFGKILARFEHILAFLDKRYDLTESKYDRTYPRTSVGAYRMVKYGLVPKKKSSMAGPKSVRPYTIAVRPHPVNNRSTAVPKLRTH